MNVSYNNLFLIKRLYLIRRARLVCTILYSRNYYSAHKDAACYTKSYEPANFSPVVWSKHANILYLNYGFIEDSPHECYPVSEVC